METNNTMVLFKVHVAITWEKKSNKTLTVLQFIDTTFQIWDKKLYSNTFTLENQTLQLDGKGISYQFYVSLSSQAHLRETMCSDRKSVV